MIGDQAQELRELADRCRMMGADNTADYLEREAEKVAFDQSIASQADQAEGLREFVRANDQAARLRAMQDVDHTTLWDQLKSELEAEAERHYQDQSGTWHGDGLKAAAARAMLDRMLRMEAMADMRRVVVPTTMGPT